jgi:HEPN domain-containing protein
VNEQQRTELPAHHPLTRSALVDDFAIRSFRDVADEDYIAARLSFRFWIPHPAIWQSQQTIEKYLKCIMLLHRIKAPRVFHDLSASLDLIQKSGKVTIQLKPISLKFLREIDAVGTYRYFEISLSLQMRELFKLDRLVWELRRYCVLDDTASRFRLTQGKSVPRYKIEGGRLEQIMDDCESQARAALLWNNGFWGPRIRKKLTFKDRMTCRNASLYMHPELVEDLLQYVYLPRKLVEEWKSRRAPDYTVPPDE